MMKLMLLMELYNNISYHANNKIYCMVGINLVLVFFILQTGLCLLTAIMGIALLVVPKETWEEVLGRVISIYNFEVSKRAMLITRFFGFILLLSGLTATYFFFIAD